MVSIGKLALILMPDILDYAGADVYFDYDGVNYLVGFVTYTDH